MTKRKAETKDEGKSKQVKTEGEEYDATLGEITEITDMPVMGEGLSHSNRFHKNFLLMT